MDDQVLRAEQVAQHRDVRGVPAHEGDRILAAQEPRQGRLQLAVDRPLAGRRPARRDRGAVPHHRHRRRAGDLGVAREAQVVTGRVVDVVPARDHRAVAGDSLVDAEIRQRQPLGPDAVEPLAERPDLGEVLEPVPRRLDRRCRARRGRGLVSEAAGLAGGRAAGRARVQVGGEARPARRPGLSPGRGARRQCFPSRSWRSHALVNLPRGPESARRDGSSRARRVGVPIRAARTCSDTRPLYERTCRTREIRTGFPGETRQAPGDVHHRDRRLSIPSRMLGMISIGSLSDTLVGEAGDQRSKGG